MYFDQTNCTTLTGTARSEFSHFNHITETTMEPRRSTGLSATKLHILDRPLSRGKNEVRVLVCVCVHAH